VITPHTTGTGLTRIEVHQQTLLSATRLDTSSRRVTPPNIRWPAERYFFRQTPCTTESPVALECQRGSARRSRPAKLQPSLCLVSSVRRQMKGSEIRRSFDAHCFTDLHPGDNTKPCRRQTNYNTDVGVMASSFRLATASLIFRHTLARLRDTCTRARMRDEYRRAPLQIGQIVSFISTPPHRTRAEARSTLGTAWS
jgi:hypothetical protein